jgi:nicotinamide riboside transporter PnuC
MTRNGIIRQCRKIDQVLFLLFVTVCANHTMYGWFRWSFAMQNVLNEAKYGDQVFTEGHDSPEQD